MRMRSYFLTILSRLLHIVVPRVKVLLSSLRKQEKEGGVGINKMENGNLIKYCKECGGAHTWEILLWAIAGGFFLNPYFF